MFSAVRDVRGLPLPGCQSPVPVSRSFNEDYSESANAILFVETS